MSKPRLAALRTRESLPAALLSLLPTTPPHALEPPPLTHFHSQHSPLPRLSPPWSLPPPTVPSSSSSALPALRCAPLGPVVTPLGSLTACLSLAQGGSVVQHLVGSDKNYQIVAVTRDTTKPASKALADQGVKVVSASVDSRDDLDRVFKGANIVFVRRLGLAGQSHAVRD